MAYASGSDVAAYCTNILGGQTGFSYSSCPTISAVNGWLSSGCSIIESQLSGHRYSTPVGAGTAAYDWLKNLNALYAAGNVEMSRANVVLAPGERTRGQVFLEMFWKQLEELCRGDLSLAGLSRSSYGKLYAGGISVSTKQTYETDSDRVEPRFGRGMFSFPGTIDPEVSSASQG